MKGYNRLVIKREKLKEPQPNGTYFGDQKGHVFTKSENAVLSDKGEKAKL